MTEGGLNGYEIFLSILMTIYYQYNFERWHFKQLTSNAKSLRAFKSQNLNDGQIDLGIRKRQVFRPTVLIVLLSFGYTADCLLISMNSIGPFYCLPCAKAAISVADKARL